VEVRFASYCSTSIPEEDTEVLVDIYADIGACKPSMFLRIMSWMDVDGCGWRVLTHRINVYSV